MTPRISIIVPVYNVEKYVEECLQSVANQTVADKLECIIVDDRGSDNSMAVVKNFINSLPSEKHEIFKILTRNKNGGLSAARNSGIKEATGEYLYFLDSDDYLLTDAMEKLLSLADKYGGVDLLPALYLRDDDSMSNYNKDSFCEFSDNPHDIKRALLDINKFSDTAANKLIRRQLLLDNHLSFKEGIIYEDSYMAFFLAKLVKRMAYCPERIYYYRINPNSITRKIDREKEFNSFKTIITDSCNNLSKVENGAEKRFIFLYLLVMWNVKSYSSNHDTKDIVSLFLSKNSFVEKCLLKAILSFNPMSSIYAKSVNLLQRIYLLH